MNDDDVLETIDSMLQLNSELVRNIANTRHYYKEQIEIVIRYPEMFPPTAEDIAQAILDIPDPKAGHMYMTKRSK